MSFARNTSSTLLKKKPGLLLDTSYTRSTSSKKTLINRWHSLLGVKRQSTASWYRERLREELRERREARGFLERLSETSDVFYNVTRAQHDGMKIATLPAFTPAHLPIYAYMVGKYTLRWGFYRTAARLCHVPHDNICEVVNPTKDSKVEKVARCHDIDATQFKAAARQLRQVWPLLY
ncbi:hypothetical protein K3495_g14320 [Podosphaera aphanis]|nr:hypothetical protein K3495_g14320 [Podosphaera aphanis]